MVLTKCPKCDGGGKKTTPLPDKTHTVISGTLPCDQCSGTGVVVADLLSTRVAPNPGPVSVIENWGEGLSKNEAEALWYTIVKALPTIAEANVDRVAAEDYAKKLDELAAENADLRARCAAADARECEFCEGHAEVGLCMTHYDDYIACRATFANYRTKSDETIDDVCERLTRRSEELKAEKELNDVLEKERQRLKHVVKLAQWWAHNPDGYNSKQLIDAVRLFNAQNEEVPDRFPSDITSPLDEIRDSILGGKNDRVASAAERAAGKVSGPAQAALMALAVELRRGT